jgi:hypothetical protein
MPNLRIGAAMALDNIKSNDSCKSKVLTGLIKRTLPPTFHLKPKSFQINFLFLNGLMHNQNTDLGGWKPDFIGVPSWGLQFWQQPIVRQICRLNYHRLFPINLIEFLIKYKLQLYKKVNLSP